jgi:hypothetical protein
MPEGESWNKGVDFVTNLIVLELNDIDVILGRDWLNVYHATRASSPFERPNYTDIKQIFDEQRLTITD